MGAEVEKHCKGEREGPRRLAKEIPCRIGSIPGLGPEVLGEAVGEGEGTHGAHIRGEVYLAGAVNLGESYAVTREDRDRAPRRFPPHRVAVLPPVLPSICGSGGKAPVPRPAKDAVAQRLPGPPR